MLVVQSEARRPELAAQRLVHAPLAAPLLDFLVVVLVLRPLSPPDVLVAWRLRFVVLRLVDAEAPPHVGPVV